MRDGLVDINRLAPRRRFEDRLAVRVVRRGDDHPFDFGVAEQIRVALGTAALILLGKVLPTFLRAAKAIDDFDLSAFLNRVGESLGPTAQADRGDSCGTVSHFLLTPSRWFARNPRPPSPPLPGILSPSPHSP